MLCPKAIESACKHFKRGILFPYSILGFLDVSPIVFQSQMFWGLITLMQISRVEVTGWWPNPLFLRKRLPHLEIPSDDGSLHGLGGEGRWDSLKTASLPLLPIPPWPFCPLLLESCSICSCQFGMSMGGDKFRIFLNLPTWTIPSRIKFGIFHGWAIFGLSFVMNH